MTQWDWVCIYVYSSDKLFQLILEVEWGEPVPLSLVEFVLEFDPMQAEGVKEALHHVHGHKYTNGEGHPHEVADPDAEECASNGVGLKGGHDGVLQEHSCKLTVSEREGPQTEVRGSV